MKTNQNYLKTFLLNTKPSAIPVFVSLIIAFPANAELQNGIASGDVTQNSAVLWTQSNALGDLKFEYANSSDFTTILGTSSHQVVDPLVPVKNYLSGLNAGQTYYYRATDNTGASAIGQFNTPATLGSRNGLKFGVSGDWRGELAPFTAISNVPERKLDFFVGLGDTTYADFPSPRVPLAQATTLTDFRNKHSEVYSSHHGLNTLADLRASTAVFATIDDHEVTNDFAGGADISSDPRFSTGLSGTLINDAPLYERGIQAFQEYYPIIEQTYSNTGSDPRMDDEVKLYRNTTFGSDAALMVLDARSFRDTPFPDVSNPLDQLAASQYIARSLTADRTMLGKRQLNDFKADLLQSQQDGVTWKFVMMPEPIQNLGIVGASDRYEGYAKERTEILKYIDDNNIENVVFVAADVHGTIVNNLEYQQLALDADGNPQLSSKSVNAFEITTGSVAFDQPFGPTLLELMATIPVGLNVSLQDTFLGQLGVTKEQFENLPVSDRDEAIKSFIDANLIDPLGFNRIGLEDSELNAVLIEGGYTSLHSYGWTEFEIDPNTQNLLVTTYGIDPYSLEDINTDIDAILNRRPIIISQFEVQPVPLPLSVWLFLSALSSLGLLRAVKN